MWVTLFPVWGSWTKKEEIWLSTSVHWSFFRGALRSWRYHHCSIISDCALIYEPKSSLPPFSLCLPFSECFITAARRELRQVGIISVCVWPIRSHTSEIVWIQLLAGLLASHSRFSESSKKPWPCLGISLWILKKGPEEESYNSELSHNQPFSPLMILPNSSIWKPCGLNEKQNEQITPDSRKCPLLLLYGYSLMSPAVILMC